MGEIYMHNLETARERYFDLIKKHGLGPDDIHAIMLGATSDAIQTNLPQWHPLPSKALDLMWADFENLRRLHEHDTRALSAFALFGFFVLLSTATLDPTSQRLPP
jgi:hypothetical protein